MIGTIVIPDDGSNAARLAFPYAERIPSRVVCLIRVEPPFQVLAPGPLENFRPDWRAVRTGQVREALEPIAEGLRNQGRTVEIVVRFGDPAEQIIAASEDADLIIMTTQGRGAAGRALFGSVADRVSRHARTPTLLVRGAAQAALPGIGRIIVPLDGSTLAEHALPLAATLATDLSLPLHLVRVVLPDQTFEEMVPGRLSEDADSMTSEALEPYQDRLVSESAAYLEGIADPLRARGLAVQTNVPVGSVASALIDEHRPDDLVVMTTHGRGGLERWLLGSVAEKLVRSAKGPVLLVRAADADSRLADPGDEGNQN
jgi:nucleotide-binding universal stress UspA family protein